ncbi:MAG: hypothetical protein CVV27_06535 [Candidatus Melainabacteria bacterium HGW-Melainabacteria-1]|nr:MAG: hypothetical protein CVV27_06535 [Candidatus Melainabacteria bacterium HGW-Melainabacteria-1]
MKVLHLPTPVGGNAWGLAQAERAIGLDSEVLIKHDTWLHYPADRILFESPPATRLEKLKTLPLLLEQVQRLSREFDVFHFNFGSTLLDFPSIGLPLAELPLFSRRGKVFVTYNGCDARQKYPTMARVRQAACHQADCYNGMCNSGKEDTQRQTKIARFARYARHVFALNPDLLYFLPKNASFLPYTVSGWQAIQLSDYQPPDRKFKIVHAPTNRVAKGSAYILAALDRLRQRYGARIEVQLIEQVPYVQALELYSQADLVIDQVLIGWYGAVTVECLKMGKPVMVFIRDEDLHFLPPEMARDCRQALINVDSEGIYEKLCELVENTELLLGYREAGLDYVHRWHDPGYVAGLTKLRYETD